MDLLIEHHPLNATAQRVFTRSGPLLVLLFFVGWIITGLIPPPSPASPSARSS
jgi:hypothetical protein